jgi:hypothetical protein
MTRQQRFSLLLTTGVIGGLAIGLCSYLAVGPHHHAAISPVRIAAGTLIVAFAMIWACYFTVWAHFTQDEFKRQREIAAGYWGGWLGIGASAPVFFFIAVGGFGPIATSRAPLLVFTLGYLLAPVFGAIGTVGARLWLVYGDNKG